jgi:subtilisin
MPVSRRRRTLAALLVLLATVSLRAQQSADGRVDVIITFSNTPGAVEEAAVRAAGGNIRRTFHLVPAISARVPESAIEGLSHNPRVLRIEPNVQIIALDAELDNSWGVKRIGAGNAHAAGYRGAGVKVAIIDTGIDYTHPDLAPNYAGGYDFVNNDGDPRDDQKHGTHVAGTIAAIDNDAGVVGVAPEARLYALKVLDANGSGNFDNVIAALQWAADNGIQVTNMSFGATQDPGITAKQAFDNTYAAGMVHIAAAGNSGNCQGTGDNVNWPARYDSVIAIAAVDASNVSPCFSSTGPKVELSAPGVNVNSTVLNGAYEVLSGTSMATPHVAGTVALMLGKGVTDGNGNGVVNDEVRQILINTAHDLGTAGRDTWYGYGLIDAAAAVQAPTPTPQPSVSVSVSTDKTSYTQTVDATAQVTIRVRDENAAAIAGLSSAAFVAKLDGINQVVTFAESAVTPGTYTTSVSIAALAAGSHSLAVTVTDTRSITGSGSATFTVTSPNTVRVDAVNYSTSGGPNGKRTLTLSVHVVDGLNRPVAGATVSVMLYWQGLLYGAANGTSNSTGNAVFDARNAPAGCYQTAVMAVIAGTRVWDEVTPPNSFCK